MCEQAQVSLRGKGHVIENLTKASQPVDLFPSSNSTVCLPLEHYPHEHLYHTPRSLGWSSILSDVKRELKSLHLIGTKRQELIED